MAHATVNEYSCLEEAVRIMQQEGELSARAYMIAHEEEILSEAAEFAREAKRICEVMVVLLRPYREEIIKVANDIAAILEEAGYQIPDDDAGLADEAGVE